MLLLAFTIRFFSAPTGGTTTGTGNLSYTYLPLSVQDVLPFLSTCV